MPAFDNFSGKISAETFKEELLHKTGYSRPEVVTGPQFGVDTSTIDIGNDMGLIAASDPLSLIPSLGMKISAYLSVHLISNDICTTGYSPQYAQFVLNLPPYLTQEQFREYWGWIHELCSQNQIAITGGHTGQIPGQESTISGGGTMFAVAPLSKILHSSGAKANDSIIMTKSAALSSTSLLALAFPEKVAESIGELALKKAQANFWNISVLKESQIAAQVLTPHTQLRAMHDVTEGGILGAVNEMATASGLGFEIDTAAINLKTEVAQVAELFGIDPLFSIGAGSMLIAVEPNSAEKLLDSLREQDIHANIIGRFTEKQEKSLLHNGQREEFEFDGTDPYWQAFFNALNLNWR
ncbi:MAG: AIR synthase family protein [Weeksellaceae bacterium]|nr:AIR synthase family protein [Weeksellaceae bacterium]